MKLLLTVFSLFVTTSAFAQLELSTGVAANKQDALGFPLHLSYDFQIKGRWYTKSQLGFKYLKRYNDFVGATIQVSTWEIHQTFSYEVIKMKGYILKPNVGLNYRFYHWKGEMDPPYNTLPQRVYVIGVRDQNFILNSYDGGQPREYRVNNLGFSFQIQNQLRLSDKVWLHLTPFLEPDYDGSQNIGGLYIGVILKTL